MTQVSILNQFAKWKRPLIGGLLSACLAEIFLLSLFAIVQGKLSANAAMIEIGTGFLSPIVIFEDILKIKSILLVRILILLFWFFVGAVVSQFIKTNLYAITCWLILFLIIFWGAPVLAKFVH